jgi:hypothetical protein
MTTVPELPVQEQATLDEAVQRIADELKPFRVYLFG